MRSVKYKWWVRFDHGPNGSKGEYQDREGLFHSWGIEADGEGQANTVAIIECPDGTIHTPIARDVVFLDKDHEDWIGRELLNKVDEIRKEIKKANLMATEVTSCASAITIVPL